MAHSVFRIKRGVKFKKKLKSSRYIADKHFHDTHVELWERSACTLYLRIRHQVHSVLDESAPVKCTAPPTGREILPTVSGGDGSGLGCT
jgi:hypothetical protein